jgi:hypothetical protein
LIQKLIACSAVKFCSETTGASNGAVAWGIFKAITFSREADWAMTQRKT